MELPLPVVDSIVLDTTLVLLAASFISLLEESLKKSITMTSPSHAPTKANTLFLQHQHREIELRSTITQTHPMISTPSSQQDQS